MEAGTYLGERRLSALNGHIAVVGDECGDQNVLPRHIATAVQGHPALDLTSAHADDAQFVLHFAGERLLKVRG